MSADGYAVIRNETLSWLLERARVEATDRLLEIPEHVARDLGPILNLGDVKAPETEERLRALGPVLSVEEHEQLLLEDRDLELPRSRHDGAFWRLVVRVVHAMLSNEGEAVIRFVEEKR